MDIIRSQEDPSDIYLTIRQSRPSNLSPDGGSFSPRQTAREDIRRPAQLSVPQPNFFRPPVPAHASISPRRYGSVGNGTYSPGSLRPQPPPPPPPPPYPLASHHSPAANLGRRHTSADIRLHGWQGHSSSPFASGNSSVQWPSSPKRASNAGDHSQHVRDVLARYEIQPHPAAYGSRQTTPPLTNETTPSTTSADSSWSLAGSRYPHKAAAADPPGPFSRRSSLASNVHSLLNPSDTAERADEDDMAIDDRKRKRLQ